MEPSPLELAKLAYAAYGESTDFKNYQGLPMPTWDDLTEPIQRAWIAAAGAMQRKLFGANDGQG